MPDRNRRGAERSGRRAETIAAWWLRLKGYTVLETRFKRTVGEIDIIARRGNIVAFVEVKRRAHQTLAETAVSPAAWRRIARTAEVWAAQFPAMQGMNWRYDLIAIVPNQWPKHYRDYWRP